MITDLMHTDTLISFLDMMLMGQIDLIKNHSYLIGILDTI